MSADGRTLAVAALLLVACGGTGDDGSSTGVTSLTTAASVTDSGTSDATASGTSTSGGTGAGTVTSDTRGTGDSGGSTGDTTTGDTGPDPSIPICWISCATAADCVQSGAAWDEDNYQCDSGRCVYTGCNGDAECQTLGGYVCKDTGAGTEYCVLSCNAASDCATAGPDFDEDNYSCDGGACVYTGCNGDAECQQKGAFVCRDTAASLFPGLEGVATCVPACQAASDCDQGLGGAYDADNYDCIDGGCIWVGCNSDAECGSGQVCQ